MTNAVSNLLLRDKYSEANRHFHPVSWLSFKASSRLRRYTFLLATAGALAPDLPRARGQEVNLLNTTFSAASANNSDTAVSQAVATSRAATELIKKYRGIPEGTPDNAAWLGVEESPLTSIAGNKETKEWLASVELTGVLTDLLSSLKASWGGRREVAIGTTGSLPRLNVSARIAIEAAGCRETSIISAASSQWGANQLNFNFPLIEKILVSQGLLSRRSVAASLGGKNDLALDMEEPGKLAAVIEKAGLPLLKAETVKDSIDKRMQIYGDPQKYLLYINVGGGIASVADTNKHRYPPGIILPGTLDLSGFKDCVIKRFLEAGTPVLNLRHIKEDDLTALRLTPSDQIYVTSSKR